MVVEIRSEFVRLSLISSSAIFHPNFGNQLSNLCTLAKFSYLQRSHVSESISYCAYADGRFITVVLFSYLPTKADDLFTQQARPVAHACTDVHG